MCKYGSGGLHVNFCELNFSAKELFKNLKLLITEDIYKLEMVKLMYRASNKTLPKSLQFFLYDQKTYTIKIPD